MFGKSAAPARARDEGEKPFWISFADLMTAMMILFLVVMVASLSSVTQRIQQAEQGEKQRGKDIAKLCHDLRLRAGDLNSTIVVDCRDNRISFGEAGRFGHNQLPSGTWAMACREERSRALPSNISSARRAPA